MRLKGSLVIAAAHAGKIPSTRLLFTHVINTGGYDTGLAIANTSADPLETEPETGSCTMSFFGTNAPPPVSTGTIVAHGITFVSDIGARNIAYGEEALVVPAKKKRPARGEHLGH